MQLIIYQEPARTRKVGEQEVVLTHPAKLKVQSTGPGAMTLLDEGPTAGKAWTVLTRVEIRETDA